MEFNYGDSELSAVVPPCDKTISKDRIFLPNKSLSIVPITLPSGLIMGIADGCSQHSQEARFQHVAHHLVAQSYLQNPNKSNGPARSGKMFSLGWRKGYEDDTTLATTGIAEKVSQDRLGYEDLQTHVPTVDTFLAERFQNLSQPLYEEVKEQFLTLNAPGLAPYFEENTDGFTCHLSLSG
ncbi:hypothetical protein H4Q26_001983 [Puccinia striiformis f. sp. tritici PST-130]|nr:hypothetical protein H4Q26_001983 [Puccinia striiformis f. sp. tritici PST-130]